MSKHNVLVVFAHWNRESSFNGAILETTLAALRAEGHTVSVSDLYEMNFNPVLSYKDAGVKSDPGSWYNYEEICKEAYESGLVSEDLKAEHAKLAAADLLLLQFPLTWQAFPAIMKGWIDRCFTCGLTHHFPSRAVFDNGLMKGKKALLSFTVACDERQSSSMGEWGDMEVLLWPIQNGVLHFAGFEVLSPNIMHSKPTYEEREKQLQAWGQRLKTIFQEKSLHFLPSSMFEKRNHVLQDADVDGRSIGFNVGQHLGKGFHPGSMINSPP